MKYKNPKHAISVLEMNDVVVEGGSVHILGIRIVRFESRYVFELESEQLKTLPRSVQFPY